MADQGFSWSAESDRLLHHMNTTNSVKEMALHFNRSEGAIRSRLKRLNNPLHKAYKRLRGPDGLPTAPTGPIPALASSSTANTTSSAIVPIQSHRNLMEIAEQGSSWSAEADMILHQMNWTHSVKEMAARFNRSEGAIRSRLKHLNNPTHKAYKRLRGSEDAQGSLAKKATGTATLVDGASLPGPSVPGENATASNTASTYSAIPLVSEMSLTRMQREIADLVRNAPSSVFLNGPYFGANLAADALFAKRV